MRTPGVPCEALERAFLQSIVYASLFDYPLTLAQLRDALIGETADEDALAACYAASPRLQATVEYLDGYYFPRGRRDLLAVRRQREARSRALLADLARPLALLTRLPFVRLVALSGSVAHLNADGAADLDVFVITRRARVWSVTVTMLVLARLGGWRRRLCLNYIVSDRALMMSPADLFCANQIVHLRPVCGEETYRRFLQANRFVHRFYPNFRPRPLHPPAAGPRGPSRAARVMEELLDWTIAPVYERLCRVLYRSHLRRRAHTWRSRDQVRLEAECLKLHTTSHRRDVMERFERALDEASRDAEAALTLVESLPAQAAR